MKTLIVTLALTFACVPAFAGVGAAAKPKHDSKAAAVTENAGTTLSKADARKACKAEKKSGKAFKECVKEKMEGSHQG